MDPFIPGLNCYCRTAVVFSRRCGWKLQDQLCAAVTNCCKIYIRDMMYADPPASIYLYHVYTMYCLACHFVRIQAETFTVHVNGSYVFHNDQCILYMISVYVGCHFIQIDGSLLKIPEFFVWHSKNCWFKSGLKTQGTVINTDNIVHVIDKTQNENVNWECK